MPSFVLRRSIVKPSGPFLAEPENVSRAEGAELRPDEVFVPEMVPRNCTLEHYDPVNVPAVDVNEEIIAYCSPDSTYAVTKRLFDAASKSIIGIDDVPAEYIKVLLLTALQRGV